MARSATSSFIIFTILLATVLNITAPAAAVDDTCKKSGEFCGGIVGYECCTGLECILDGDYADAGGECRPTSATTCRTAGQFCGGIAGFQCCQGLRCVLDGDFPDAGGKCKGGYKHA